VPRLYGIFTGDFCVILEVVADLLRLATSWRTFEWSIEVALHASGPSMPDLQQYGSRGEPSGQAPLDVFSTNVLI